MAIWMEESGNDSVWHRVNTRLTEGNFTAACALRLRARGSRIWPQKPGEPGPAQEARCHTCLVESSS
jgi:hypothetical protein